MFFRPPDKPDGYRECVVCVDEEEDSRCTVCVSILTMIPRNSRWSWDWTPAGCCLPIGTAPPPDYAGCCYLRRRVSCYCTRSLCLRQRPMKDTTQFRHSAAVDSRVGFICVGFFTNFGMFLFHRRLVCLCVLGLRVSLMMTIWHSILQRTARFTEVCFDFWESLLSKNL